MITEEFNFVCHRDIQQLLNLLVMILLIYSIAWNQGLVCNITNNCIYSSTLTFPFAQKVLLSSLYWNLVCSWKWQPLKNTNKINYQEQWYECISKELNYIYMYKQTCQKVEQRARKKKHVVISGKPLHSRNWVLY